MLALFERKEPVKILDVPLVMLVIDCHITFRPKMFNRIFLELIHLDGSWAVIFVINE